MAEPTVIVVPSESSSEEHQTEHPGLVTATPEFLQQQVQLLADTQTMSQRISQLEERNSSLLSSVEELRSRSERTETLAVAAAVTAAETQEETEEEELEEESEEIAVVVPPVEEAAPPDATVQGNATSTPTGLQRGLLSRLWHGM